MDIFRLHPIDNIAVPVSVPPEKALENREIVHAVKQINQARLFGDNSELTFIVDRETRRPVTRLVDRNTKEVIRQIPSEEVLRLAESITFKE